MCVVACERGHISGVRFSHFSERDERHPELKYVYVRRLSGSSIEIVNKLNGIKIIFMFDILKH